ncbi:glycosyltransferase family 2 protein [Hydrogenimonas urashimensis]|uniref:glycosyltransferase family 2 protein n=1 Tax=Hydrogenimonas urashimensis TaxID=2740515 RepID=UPI0019158A4F|nr:glycosyltransferase [Hydrogenimonas urashimensis]
MSKNNTDEILVSIPMLAYNHEEYIAEAIDSVLMQQVNFNYEIIIGEDCSTDNTRQIVLDYQKKYPDKIKLILHEKNVGMEANADTVFKACKGKYIAPLEGDDYWIDPHKLQIQVDMMRQYPECHISFHPAEVRYGFERKGKVIAQHANENKIFSLSEIIRGGGGFCPTASTMYLKAAKENFPKFKNKPLGDYYTQIFASQNGGALYINRVMSVYRKGAKSSWSSSMKNLEKREKWSKEIIAFFYELDEYFDNKYQKEIFEKISNHYYRMAQFYFHLGFYHNFKQCIELSYKHFPYNSPTYLLYYHFRSNPKIINYLKKIYKKIFHKGANHEN